MCCYVCRRNSPVVIHCWNMLPKNGHKCEAVTQGTGKIIIALPGKYSYRTCTVKPKCNICNITTYDSNVSCMIGTPSSIGFGKSILSCSQSHSANGSWFWGKSRGQAYWHFKLVRLAYIPSASSPVPPTATIGCCIRLTCIGHIGFLTTDSTVANTVHAKRTQ